MFGWKKVGTLSKIGIILIIVSIILDLIGFVFLILAEVGILGEFERDLYLPIGFGALGGFLTLLVLIGIIVNFFTLKATSDLNIKRAGILAIIASILPPLDVLSLIAGIMFLLDGRSLRRKG